MKAREWYEKLKANSTTDEDFENTLENCLESLIQDADNLIRIRRAKSDQAVAACINEVNSKWLTIVSLHENDKNIPEGNYFHQTSVKLLSDGFKAAYVQSHPNRGWYFDIKKHKENREMDQFKLMGMDLTNPTLILFGLTPYTKITDLNINDLRMEFLHAAYSLGALNENNAMPNNVIKVYSNIIASYMLRLQIWIKSGKIDAEDIDMANSALIAKYGEY